MVLHRFEEPYQTAVKRPVTAPFSTCRPIDLSLSCSQVPPSALLGVVRLETLPVTSIWTGLRGVPRDLRVYLSSYTKVLDNGKMPKTDYGVDASTIGETQYFLRQCDDLFEKILKTWEDVIGMDVASDQSFGVKHFVARAITCKP